MAGMLELSDQNFFKIMINMKRDLIEKADNMQASEVIEVHSLQKEAHSYLII